MNSAMSAYKNGKKNSKLNIIVNLKSLLFAEVLCKTLNREINGYKALILDDSHAVADFKPDLVLVDLPNLNQWIFQKWPETKVVMVDTGLPEEDTITEMRSFKLYGIISPAADLQQLKKALHVIQHGQIWIDNARLKAILHGNTYNNGGKAERLSKKEAQITELVAEGYKNKEIASMLYLSEQTVKSHLGRIFKKMNVTNRSQLVSLTIKNKLLEHQAL